MTGTINPTLPAAGEPNSTADPKVLGSLKTLRDEINALLDSSNKIPASSLATGVGQMKWYTPKVIATEEGRTNTAFGTLATPDEIKEVVIPTNGLLHVHYEAAIKQSAEGINGLVAIFLSANQLKDNGSPINFVIPEATFKRAALTETGLNTSGGWLTPGTTGALTRGGMTIFAAPGTYDLSMQFKSSSGTITAKERKLWAYTLG